MHAEENKEEQIKKIQVKKANSSPKQKLYAKPHFLGYVSMSAVRIYAYFFSAALWRWLLKKMENLCNTDHSN